MLMIPLLTLNLHDSVESDLRVSLVNNEWCVPTRPPFSSLFSQPRIIDLSVQSTLAEFYLHDNLRYRGVKSDLRISREQRVGGSLLGHRSRRSFFSPGSSTSTSSVRSLNPLSFVNSWWLP
ncbi:hypothetical protein TNCV_4668651 [Trichonephila clavipes]|nr:hypothetical protein TNCV_4668651 [Trichonephila clavipes]